MNYKGIELVENDGDYYFEDKELDKARTALIGRGLRDKDTDERRRAWMEREGVVARKGKFCLTKVSKGKKHRCRYENAACEPLRKEYYWSDHSELFWHPASQTYVLTSQPYNFSLARLKEMEPIVLWHGLTFEVSVKDAWWYPGAAPLLVWRKKNNFS